VRGAVITHCAEKRFCPQNSIGPPTKQTSTAEQKTPAIITAGMPSLMWPTDDIGGTATRCSWWLLARVSSNSI